MSRAEAQLQAHGAGCRRLAGLGADGWQEPGGVSCRTRLPAWAPASHHRPCLHAQHCLPATWWLCVQESEQELQKERDW